MITENELRIGNYVKHDDSWCYRGENVTVFQWEVQDWYAFSECRLFLESIKPIPLTEEWLVKFGFTNEVVNVLENDNFKMSISYYDGWHLSYKEKQCFGSSEVYLYPANIGSVHALQNLYFSLTGQELTLK